MWSPILLNWTKTKSTFIYGDISIVKSRWSTLYTYIGGVQAANITNSYFVEDCVSFIPSLSFDRG